MIIAREVSRDPAVLVASQPTRGLDVGAIEYVHRRLVTERDEGRAILLVSLELEEVAVPLGPDPRDLRGPDRRPSSAPDADRDALGAAMLGGPAGARVSTTAPPHPAAGAARARRRRRSRRRADARPGAPRTSGASSPRSPRRSWPSCIAGLVVLATGHNPLQVYKGIFEGAGLNWILPWVTGDAREDAAFNLQQTLLQTTTLILTGLAVAFAFRCGLFNIGGQGQWTMGAIVSVWVGSSWAGHGRAGPHLPGGRAGDACRRRVGGDRRLPEGDRRRPRGGHHDHAQLDRLLGRRRTCSASGGRCRTTRHPGASVPISNDIVEARDLPVIWGDPVLQGLSIGIFIAFGALVVYWLTLSRTTLGFRVRAVGRSAEAARYGGISVRNELLPGDGDLGRVRRARRRHGHPRLAVPARHARRPERRPSASSASPSPSSGRQHRGRGAVRGVPVRRAPATARRPGASTRTSSTRASPATSPLMIQGLVLLFIGADVLILWLWSAAKLGWFRMPRLPPCRAQARATGTARAGGFAASDMDVPPAAAPPGGRAAPGVGAGARATRREGRRGGGILWRCWPSGSRCRRSRRAAASSRS